MVLGFNHNITYKGELFHVQTEDSGVDSPHIITLLYRGGVIISSRKTSYADILRMENLEIVVEELMKEQHKEMMRRLKAGEFDDKAFLVNATLIENYEIPVLEPHGDTVADIFSSPPTSRQTSSSDLSLLFEVPVQAPRSPLAASESSRQTDSSKPPANLDDTILNFFGNPDKK
ncbi:MAG TPA: hypothetical protein HPP94_15365 [Desulfuromonadales bacterium]|nr:hypothetical protein [Desulfuromonadales bacterium]